MAQGVSGYFDIAGDYGFTARVFYSEACDESTGNRIVSITGISVQSTTYGGTWYPGGTVSMDEQVLGQEMSYNSPATHSVYISAGDGWYEIQPITYQGGIAFPWASGEISSGSDGSCSVTFDVALTFYRDSSTPRPVTSGSMAIDLAQVDLGPVAWVRRNGTPVRLTPYLRKDGTTVALRSGIF